MKPVSLRLPSRLASKLERAAKQRGQSKSAVVRMALEQFLNGERPADAPISALKLAGNAVGCANGPVDLSADPKYMQGYGK
jgi:predicted transcriptional regulator